MENSLRKLVDIAKDKEMYPEVLKMLYSTLKDNEEHNNEIRRGLSLNVNCPIEILEKLSKDDLVDIRKNVASHVHANEKILQNCTKDSSKEVRYIAVQNLNVTEDILITFLKDEDEQVSLTARKILKQRL